ncbi:uncharacterized protein EDB91DRAFT_1241873 [Suillus paluster]|uniref:uncharacterized protein n=1 Tax=Suillus paluster TaxID=48578 RepID=UPI001B86CCD5|nr:uncharacterized protein EDB91DRAFT_1241873 [Suillus paluster]KAG1756828.1 hypothetical protein EDB91DRAFT_1241873 [Suillus paluster]
MNTRRSRAPIYISFSPRASLENSSHSTVDGILKDLKAYARRLQAALATYQDEMQVLERLYYRSKNQHRVALFFKRVSEIRRYGWRLLEANMPEDVHLLRASFYGASVIQSEKLMRGPWNHVPSRSCTSFITERFKEYSVLILKTSERVREAYHHFALAMQSGSFIQLIVLFAGLSSRMATLLTELGDCVQGCESACDRVLTPAHKASFIAESRTSKAVECLAQQSDKPTPAIGPDVPSEDVGSAVSRAATVDVPSVDAEAVMENAVNINFDPLQAAVGMSPSPSPLASNSVSNESELSVVEKVTVTALSTQKDRIATKRKISSTPADQRRSKKVKEKRNEIDDIFGF